MDRSALHRERKWKHRELPKSINDNSNRLRGRPRRRAFGSSPNLPKTQTIRIALLDQFCKPKASHYHWHRNGFYRCNTPKDGPEAPCCKIQRSWTCVCLAIHYLSADPDGKLRKGADIKYRVGYVSLSRTAYTHVSGWMKEAPGCDLCYTKSDGSYSFQGVSRTPAWKLAPGGAGRRS